MKIKKQIRKKKYKSNLFFNMQINNNAANNN